MKLLSIFALSLAFHGPAWAATKSVDTLLQEFSTDSQKFMNTIPEKTGKTPKFFSRNDIKKKNFVGAKNENRALRGRAAIEGNDRAEDLVDNGSNLLTSLAEMDKKKLQKAELKKNPWSDHYWALYQGQLAYRYGDSRFPDSEDWKKNSDYILKNPAVVAGGDAAVNSLSPAEKYDLLVGDSGMSLTRKALAEGEYYYNSTRKVESWMGLCHGWAAAAYMLDRPANAINVTAADGRTEITFYPSDIKALATLLWAVNPGETNFIGGRCNEKNPKQNREGRIVDSGCFDTNPGAWHLSVVNQIGVSKRSLVMDATFDYEVWNHPIKAYSYKYFNPQTRKETSSLKDAAVSMRDFSNDKFSDFRARNAETVVGVAMTVEYMVETNPSTGKKDSESKDATNTVTYLYDLELDASGDIIGGEWYQNAHPDFLWTPTADSRALTPGDRMLGRSSWNGSSALPSDVRDVAIRSSAQGAPLATIVEGLIERAKGR